MPLLVTTSAELLARLPALAAAPAIAVDAEFHPEKAYTPKLMLLQLGPVGGEALLVDPFGAVDLTLLGPVLSERPLLVHGGAQDLLLLHRHTGARPTEVFDTQVAAGFAGLGFPRRLQDLLAELGFPALDKGETLSDWSRRPLSPSQLRYALDDVRVLPALADRLRERVASFGNTEVLATAQREAAAAALAPPDVQRAWRRIPGAHLLSAPERAALHALAAWREARAQALDTPVGHLISDAVLLDIARRHPDSIERLRENRRMPSQVWRQYGEELLAALRSSASAVPPEPLPRGAKADAIRLGARAAAESRGISGELLLTDCELDYIMKKIDSGSWRRSTLGDDFTSFLEGRSFIDANGRLVQT